jgi:hypothetical protein
MTRLLLIAAALLALASPAEARDKFQSCRGIMTLNGAAYRLEPDANSTPWCDATIYYEFVGQSMFAKVLEVCPVDSRCWIKGTYAGRGVFYWMKILQVRHE